MIRRLKTRFILFYISNFYGFSVKRIIKHDRTTDKVQARFVYFYVSNKLGYTFGETANLLDMDRNTARHGVERIDDIIKAVYNHPDQEHIPADVQYLIKKLHRCRKIRR